VTDGTRLYPASSLNSPYGCTKLIDLMASPQRAAELKAASRDYPSLDLTARELGDIEMLATGAFSPLSTFMGRDDYESVCADMRLRSGTLWPLPVVLEAPPKLAEGLAAGICVALRDAEGTLIAVLTVEEMFERDRRREAELLYRAPEGRHPDVAYLYKREGHVCLSGKLEVVELPVQHDFTALRRSPATVRADMMREGSEAAVGYAPGSLLHRAHVEFSRHVALKSRSWLLVFAPVGLRHMEEPAYYPRVRALRAALEHYPRKTVRLNVSPLSPRQAGPRAALLSAIVARNFGCSRFICEHDTADLGDGAAGAPLYGHYEAIVTLQRHARELGLEIVAFNKLIHEEHQPELLLNNPLRGPVKLEASGLCSVAKWFTYPTVLHEVQKPLRGGAGRGFTVFFTGLSGAGKSTIARILQARLMERGERHVTMLDGDLVRKHLSSELGFSREHRDLNVLRLGYVASLVTQHRGIAICAPIAPYAATRAQVRAMVEPHGAFVEVFVATSLEVCEQRDRKGLYARARKGLIPQFTGISDPYEAPTHAEISIDTSQVSAVDAVERILGYLTQCGYLVGPESRPVEAPEAEAGRFERELPEQFVGELSASN
jgi:sulfate adenylyltransferase